MSAGFFSLITPRGGATAPPRRAQPHMLLFRFTPPPHRRGGEEKGNDVPRHEPCCRSADPLNKMPRPCRLSPRFLQLKGHGTGLTHDKRNAPAAARPVPEEALVALAGELASVAGGGSAAPAVEPPDGQSGSSSAQFIGLDGDPPHTCSSKRRAGAPRP